MQFITDVIKQIKNPFIIDEGNGSYKLKWLDDWTDDEEGYGYKCRVSENGHVYLSWKSDYQETDPTRAYYVWMGKRALSHPSKMIEQQIYSELYKKWEGELRIKYRQLGVTEKDVRACYESHNKHAQERANDKERKYTAAVYLIQMNGTNFYKIGVAKKATDRIKQLQTGNPIKLNLIYSSRVTDSFGLENALHQLVKEFKVHNEWFELSEENLKYVMNHLEGVRS